MTTPAPERSTGRRRRPHQLTHRPQMQLSWLGWFLSWLLPTALLGAVLLGLSFVPGLDGQGYLAPLIPVIGAATVVIGLPGTLLLRRLLKYQLSLVTHVLGYVLVGLLYGPVVLISGVGGLLPMLIPLVGFPAGIIMGLTRWAVQPLTEVTGSQDGDPSGSADEDHPAHSMR